MTTDHIERGSSGSRYYFDPNCSTTSQSYKNYSSPVTTTRTYGSSDYSTCPVGIASVRSPRQQIRLDRNIYDQDDPYQLPLNRGKATIRLVNDEGQYRSQGAIQPIQISPQHQNFQFDSRQQPYRSTSPMNADIWTKNTSQGHNHHIQVLSFSFVFMY
jgi:hypothetical protein